MKKLFFLLSTVFMFSGVASAQTTMTLYLDVSANPDWEDIGRGDQIASVYDADYNQLCVSFTPVEGATGIYQAIISIPSSSTINLYVYGSYYWALDIPFDGSKDCIKIDDKGDISMINYGVDTGLGQNIIAGAVSVYTENNAIRAMFGGCAQVEVYDISGALLTKTTAVGSFEQTGLVLGLYIVKINDKATKVAVK
jgi:hypothetical protein